MRTVVMISGPFGSEIVYARLREFNYSVDWREVVDAMNKVMEKELKARAERAYGDKLEFQATVSVTLAEDKR